MKQKKKIVAATTAVVTAAALLFGGTFAWQSINQTALNEASDVINPGGRLHDDFDGTNKDVYVENFADDPIFARVRLDEYFEIVMNKGAVGAEKTEVVTKYENEDGDLVDAVKGDTSTYVTHDFAGGNLTDEYWNWATGGSTIYLPTFNMNKDSLAADINGTYNGLDGVVTDDANDDRYSDNETYEDKQEVPGTEIYDADTNNIDEFADGTEELGVTYTEVEATHTATSTLDATLISMEEWKALSEDEQIGEYWVYDTDGWVYWADAIQPDTATGLLLDGIELTQVMDDSWYYAINVVAQFVTADDLGRGSGTGFYDLANGTAPTDDALALLAAIGVDTTSVVDDADSLREALEAGSDVVINGEIETDTTEDNKGLNIDFDYLWSEGGTVSGGTINSTTGSYATLFINNENNWPVDGDGAYAATLEDTTINTQSTFGVYTQAFAAPVTLKDVTINGSVGGFYAEYGDETVTLENVTVNAAGGNTEKPWFNSAVAAGMGANVVVNSGSYTGEYAAYVYSSGANLTINGGYFDGALKEDNADLIIKGGTFTEDPSAFVADGYEAVYDEEAETWTVQEKEQSSTSRIKFEGITPDERNWVGVTSDITTANVTIYDENGNPYVTGEGAEYLMYINMGGATRAVPGMIENGNGFLQNFLSEFDGESTSYMSFGITKATGDHLTDIGSGMMLVNTSDEDAMVWESADYVFYNADNYTFDTTYTYTDEDFSEGIEFYVFTSTENSNAHVIDATGTWVTRGIYDTGISYNGDVSVLNGDILRDYIVSEPVVTVRCNNDEGAFTAGNTYTFTATSNSQTSFTWTVTKGDELIYTETTDNDRLKNSTYELAIPADAAKGSVYEIAVTTSTGGVTDTYEFTVS